MNQFSLNTQEDANNFAQKLIDQIAECLESGKGGTMLIGCEQYVVSVKIDRHTLPPEPSFCPRCLAKNIRIIHHKSGNFHDKIQCVSCWYSLDRNEWMREQKQKERGP